MNPPAERRIRTHPGDIHPARLRRLLAGEWFDAPIILYDRIGSTNAEAVRLARGGCEEGTLLIAEDQRRGRGRGARSWSSAPGKDLIFSLVLKPAEPFEGLTQLLALSAVRVLEVNDVPALVKWPNDIFLGERKLAGILADAWRGGTVLGMGINVNTAAAEFPEEIRETAVSLADHAGRIFDRERILAMILLGFKHVYRRYLEEGFDSLRAEIQSRLIYLGESVSLSDGSGSRTGRLLGLDERGHLRLGTERGEIVLPAGDLSLRGDDA